MENTQDSRYGKTCPVLSVVQKEMTLELCLKKSQKPKFQCLIVEDGQPQEWLEAVSVKLHGESLTLSIGESPQRRKRIFLVADFTGQRASEILFVEEGLRGNFAESRSEGQGITGSVEGCVDKTKCITPWDCQSKRIFEEGGVYPCLQAMDGGGANNTAILTLDNVASTLRAGAGAPKHEADERGRLVLRCSGYSNYKADNVAATQRACVAKMTDVDLVLETCFEPRSQDGVPRIHGELCPTLNTAQGGQRQPCIVTRLFNEAVGEPIPINDKATRYKGGGETRNNDGAGNGLGIGNPGDPMPTMTAGDRHAVAYTAKQFANYQEGVGTLKASGGDIGGGSETLVKTGYKVRRLTPTECERLQGLPDGWTAGGSDTARYKAIGNGMAQPCVDFVIGGIADVLRG